MLPMLGDTFYIKKMLAELCGSILRSIFNQQTSQDLICRTCFVFHLATNYSDSQPACLDSASMRFEARQCAVHRLAMS